MLLTTYWGAVPRRATVLDRLAVRERGAAFWAGLWAAAVAAELLALIPVFEGDVTGPDVVYILAAGSFAACGLVAWRRRPDNLSGRLMTATGFAAFAYPLLSQLGAPLTLTLAVLLNSTWTIGYVALLLAFMTGGRLESAVDLVLVGLYTLTLLILQVPWMMFVELEGNLLLVEPDAQVAEAIDDARLWLTAATTLAIVAVIALRWRAASRPRRKALLPGVMGIVSGLLYVVQLLVVLLAEAPFPELPFWLTSFALLLVPAAYLFGLLRSRLARGGLAELFLGLGTMRGEELRAALGRALGDPSLEVVHGRAEPADGRSVAPIERGGEQVALELKLIRSRIRRWPSSSRTPPPPSWRCRSRSCASSRAGSTPRCSTRASHPRCSRSRRARPSQPASRTRRPSGCRSRSSSPPTSSRQRRSRTSPSTRGPRGPP
jgi:hypothetical protein